MPWLLIALVGCDERPPALESTAAPPQQADSVPSVPPPPPSDGETVAHTCPNGLVVHITSHSLGDGVPCCTLVTEGLSGHEVSFTLRRDRAIELGPLLAFCDALHRQGDPQGPYQLLTVPAGGLLGNSRFPSVLFIPSVLSVVSGTETALTGILLTKDEAEWVFRVGPQRVLGRLGKQERFFPTTPWADPERFDVVDPSVASEAPFNHTPSLFLSSARINRLGEDVEISLAADDFAELRRLGGLQSTQLRILAGRSRAATGVFVYEPDAPPMALSAVESATCLALNGLLVSKEEHDAVVFLEDYAVLVCSPELWEQFWAQLEADEPAALQVGEATLHFINSQTTVWHPDTRRSSGPVQGIELSLDDELMSQRVDTPDLTRLLGDLEQALVEADRGDFHGPATLDVELHPDGHARIDLVWDQARPEWGAAFRAALGQVALPPVIDVVGFRMHLLFGKPSEPDV